MNYREMMAVRVLNLYENTIEHKVKAYCIKHLFPALDSKIDEMVSSQSELVTFDTMRKHYNIYSSYQVLPDGTIRFK
jgi:hypothetical protein